MDPDASDDGYEPPDIYDIDAANDREFHVAPADGDSLSPGTIGFF
jgi:hypothetical protein